MKVELEGSLRKALLKGCLWMGESGENSEGGQDEAGQRPKLQLQLCSTAKTYDEDEFSKSEYL